MQFGQRREARYYSGRLPMTLRGRVMGIFQIATQGLNPMGQVRNRSRGTDHRRSRSDSFRRIDRVARHHADNLADPANSEVQTRRS